MESTGVEAHYIGEVEIGTQLTIDNGEKNLSFNVPKHRDIWYKTSHLLDQKQSGKKLATSRFNNYKKQALEFVFPIEFSGKINVIANEMKQSHSDKKIKAAVIREKGSNSEREMAYAMQLAGFDVKDVHMTDLISGRETLEDIQFIVAVGGFSNSDVLGSAKGWAGAFLYNRSEERRVGKEC